MVGRDDDESVDGGSESDDDAASWETVEEHERDALENAEEVDLCETFYRHINIYIRKKEKKRKTGWLIYDDN